MSSRNADGQAVEFEEIIQRAAQEQWTELAIVTESLFRDQLINSGWQPERAFVVAGPIGFEGARRLAQLRGLTMLALWGTRIGDKGARALSQLSGLTTLTLPHNRIGAAG